MSYLISLKPQTDFRLLLSPSPILKSDVFLLEDFLSPEFVDHLHQFKNFSQYSANQLPLLEQQLKQVEEVFETLQNSIGLLRKSIITSILTSFEKWKQDFEDLKDKLKKSHRKVLKTNIDFVPLLEKEERNKEIHKNKKLDEFISLYQYSKQFLNPQVKNLSTQKFESGIQIMRKLTTEVLSFSFGHDGDKESQPHEDDIGDVLDSGLKTLGFDFQFCLNIAPESRGSALWVLEDSAMRFQLGGKPHLYLETSDYSGKHSKMVHYEKKKIINSINLKDLWRENEIVSYSEDLNLFISHFKNTVIFSKSMQSLKRIFSLVFPESVHFVQILGHHKTLLMETWDELHVVDIFARKTIQKIKNSGSLIDVIYLPDIDSVAALYSGNNQKIFNLYKVNHLGTLEETFETVLFSVFTSNLHKIFFENNVFVILGKSEGYPIHRFIVLELLGGEVRQSYHKFEIEHSEDFEDSQWLPLVNEQKLVYFGSNSGVIVYDWATHETTCYRSKTQRTLLVNTNQEKVFHEGENLSWYRKKNFLKKINPCEELIEARRDSSRNEYQLDTFSGDK